MRLCFAKDRLYLLEHHEVPVRGRRILVLSLQGDILQVVTHPTEPTAVFHSMCCFDHKLLAGYTSVTARLGSAGIRSAAGVLALQGL